MPVPQHSVFTGQIPFLLPNQQRQKFKALKALKANETKNLTNFRHEPQHNNLHCHSTVQANVHVDNRNWELTC